MQSRLAGAWAVKEDFANGCKKTGYRSSPVRRKMFYGRKNLDTCLRWYDGTDTDIAGMTAQVVLFQ